MYQKWELALFEASLNDLLAKIHDSQMSWYQFCLVIREGGFKFRGLSQQLKFKKYFQQNQFVSKTNLREYIELCETFVSNNRRFYVIRMKESSQSAIHKPLKCFSWWLQFMTKKFGPDIKWFDVLAKNKNSLRIKAFDFKQSMSKILEKTDHYKCHNKIASFFPKTQKNQIEFGIFMNTIKVTSKPHLYREKSSMRKFINSTIKTQTDSKQRTFQKTPNKLIPKRMTTQTSQTFYLTDFGKSLSIENEQKIQIRENYFLNKKRLRKHTTKSHNTFYSIPIRDAIQKQSNQKRQSNWTVLSQHKP